MTTGRIDATQAQRSPREGDLAGTREPGESECWALLESAAIGRLAVRRDEEIDLFPINFLVHEGRIYYRSAPGSKLADTMVAPIVAFETDGQTEGSYWSVVVHGIATRLAYDDEIEKSGVNSLATWAPGNKFNYMKITPTRLSGRVFPRIG